MLSDSERALARAVLIHGPISRSELTSRLGLSPPSLTRLAKPFLDRGLLVELDDRSDGSVGRPVRPLDVRPGLAHFAGVKITGEALHVVATDVRAGLLAYEEHPLQRRDPEGVAAEIARAVRGLGVDRIAGVGVSLGGAVRDGRVEFAPFLDWTDVPFAAARRGRAGGPRVDRERPRRPRRGRALVRARRAASPGSSSSPSAPASATRSS